MRASKATYLVRQHGTGNACIDSGVVKGFVSCSDCGICPFFFLTADEWDFRVEERGETGRSLETCLEIVVLVCIKVVSPRGSSQEYSHRVLPPCTHTLLGAEAQAGRAAICQGVLWLLYDWIALLLAMCCITWLLAI